MGRFLGGNSGAHTYVVAFLSPLQLAGEFEWIYTEEIEFFYS